MRSSRPRISASTAVLAADDDADDDSTAAFPALSEKLGRPVAADLALVVRVVCGEARDLGAMAITDLAQI